MTVVVLTGATRGIGRAAAIELVRRGAEVALVGREPERVKSVAEEATAVGGGGRVHGHVADLALMSNVRVLADEIRGRYEHVDVLANNAGALFASRRETAEGFEQTFALNHLAPFLLTNLLRDRLAGGRVVTTASGAHRSGRLDLDDLQSEKSYSARVYAPRSCATSCSRASWLGVRRSCTPTASTPASCAPASLKNENGVWKIVATLGAPFLRSPERGARSLVWLALSEDAAALTGKYIEDEKVVAPSAQAQDTTSHTASGNKAPSSSACPPPRVPDANDSRTLSLEA